MYITTPAAEPGPPSRARSPAARPARRGAATALASDDNDNANSNDNTNNSNNDNKCTYIP